MSKTYFFIIKILLMYILCLFKHIPLYISAEAVSIKIGEIDIMKTAMNVLTEQKLKRNTIRLLNSDHKKIVW